MVNLGLQPAIGYADPAGLPMQSGQFDMGKAKRLSLLFTDENLPRRQVSGSSDPILYC